MIILILALFTTQARAWDHHQDLMGQLMDSKAASLRPYLKSMIEIPSEKDQSTELEKISSVLEVNVEKIPIQKVEKLSVQNFIRGSSIDEPDLGMDQDLPDSSDPQNDRAWMGGKTGPTSQGFRHMVFPGISWGSPLKTLQIPFGTIGQAPTRVQKLHALSKKYFEENNPYWGLRLLLWELHFIQDLHQPFHVTQVPYYKMLPWKEWYRKFVRRSTQVIANFHYAYEGLVREAVQDGELSRLKNCFELESKPNFPELNAEMIQQVIESTRNHAEAVGIPLFNLWDLELKDPIVDLPNEIGGIDYYSYLNASLEEEEDRVKSVEAILKPTCELMKNLSAISFSLIDRAFQFQ